MAAEPPINLRAARKRMARVRSEEAAARNRAQFGRSPAQKAREEADAKRAAAFLDARRREPEETP